MLFFYITLASDENKKKVEYLFNKFHKFMLFTANGLVNNIETAEDMVQISFLKLIEHIDKINIDTGNENKNKNFVRTIVVNASLDYLRRKNNQPKEEVIEEREDGYEAPDSSPLPLERITHDEGYEKLIGYISELNDTYKEVCRLKFIHDCTEKEIAALLNLPEKTVSVKIYRARKILKKKITESVGEKNEPE